MNYLHLNTNIDIYQRLNNISDTAFYMHLNTNIDIYQRGKTIGMNIPNIPLLKDGGVVSQPTLAMLFKY